MNGNLILDGGKFVYSGLQVFDSPTVFNKPTVFNNIITSNNGFSITGGKFDVSEISSGAIFGCIVDISNNTDASGNPSNALSGALQITGGTSIQGNTCLNNLFTYGPIRATNQIYSLVNNNSIVEHVPHVRRASKKIK